MSVQDQKLRLYAAVSQCNVIILQLDRDNDIDRSNRFLPDAQRLERHRKNRASIVKLRQELESAYAGIYGENPWANIPF